MKKYNNLIETKTEILEMLSKNKNRAGVYQFINLVNNKSYVGSSSNLVVLSR